MSVAGRKLVESINWPTISAALSKRSDVVKSIGVFNKKYQELDRELSALREQKLDIDFSHYSSVLKNTAVVDEMKAKLASFKITKIDTSKSNEILSKLEAAAVASATEYSTELGTRLSGLIETVKNIEETRPVIDLTVEDVVKAAPEALTEVQEMMKEGEFIVKGYDNKFPDLSLS
ncbi:hypothetical protein BB560_001367 [Smittium megazygosporum]|uniref:ATP synthase subunit d, mitochondrial n=1 Tax=Smittium megazygosporum TaxID=133381 RepID=A0A2T9ZHT3_9FUNG|nr:hypothetical protein BB560_001367 [Smittium megazygosporum]